MSLQTPDKIRKLHRKLYAKAKQEPRYRFYLLYDKVHRPDILEHAYALAKSNGGAPGVDGVTFDAIESAGREAFLAALGKELHDRTYRPQPVRRVRIPKPNGGQRPLGIPTIRDRVAQTAAKMVLEPIFEADFVDEAYGYRPRRSASQAVEAVHRALREGFTEVVDADLSRYFDTIPHRDLMRSLARRVSDKHMLRLIRRWLKAPVEERDERGGRHRSGGKGCKQGTPQGGVISPLLANVYMHRFLRYWHREGKGRQFLARLVNYADDFVILCRGKAAGAMKWTAEVMGKIGLTLNSAKTCIRDARSESFDFLGYTFGRRYNPACGRWYLAARPSAPSVRRVKQTLRGILQPWNVGKQEEVFAQINRVLRGWNNYFGYGTLKAAYKAVDNCVYEHVRHFLRRRHKTASSGTTLVPSGKSLRKLGIVRLFDVLMQRRPVQALG